MVSSGKGTILNYFGLANTYNPFTDENALQAVQNLDFEIPTAEPFVNAGYVAVSTGLLATSLSFLNDSVLAIYDTDGTAKIADLTNVIGELGNDKYFPKEGEVFWFNKDGLRGTYFLNKIYAGKKLRIVSGRYVTTSVTSGVLNDIFARTTGVPAYIEEINNMIKEVQNNSTFIIKETITKSGSGNQQWELDWRDDLEYLQVSGYIGGKNNTGSFGLYQSINDLVPFIGWFFSYYYGGDFQMSYANWKAGLPNIKWFPILNTKPILAIKNASNQTITATLYFMVRYKNA
ncbi:phage tail protein [Brachyspira intermedia]|uniref:phage tail protein n=1 Tax=Brachyspira intermedia TaxID=84377 RepID=UPI003004EBBE